MLQHPNFSEAIFTIPQFELLSLNLGPFSVHWYGVMYLCGFYAGLWLGQYRARKRPELGWTQDMVSDFLFYVVAGIILGGRFGYVFFYGFDSFLDDPMYLFRIYEGGMSFHGGFLGVCAATWLFARKHNKSVFEVGDFVAPLTIPGLGFGRLGNFIGQELWGHETDVPWAMVFPDDPLGLARHPSQLYEFALEGVLLFIILWLFSGKLRPQKAVAGLFMIGYGCFRIFVEIFRMPDNGIFFPFEPFTKGMVLSLPMVIVGIGFMVVAYKQQKFDRYTLDKNGKFIKDNTAKPQGSV